MSISTETHDLEELAACLSAGRSIDPELKNRIRRRSEKLRQERFEKHGYLNMAVDLVREVREE